MTDQLQDEPESYEPPFTGFFVPGALWELFSPFECLLWMMVHVDPDPDGCALSNQQLLSELNGGGAWTGDIDVALQRLLLEGFLVQDQTTRRRRLHTETHPHLAQRFTQEGGEVDE